MLSETHASRLVDSTSTPGNNCRRPALAIDWQTRAALKYQAPRVVWFTGLSAAGKSTIASVVERQLVALSHHTYLLDGDIVRYGLCRDLGFSETDRSENVRRVAEVAALMADAGLIVLVSMISPLQEHRRLARDLVGAGWFVEVFVDVPLAVAEARDPKGLYQRARRGEIRNFTGIDAPYEPPGSPDVHLNAAVLSPGEAAARVVEHLLEMKAVHDSSAA